MIIFCTIFKRKITNLQFVERESQVVTAFTCWIYFTAIAGDNIKHENCSANAKNARSTNGHEIMVNVRRYAIECDDYSDEIKHL